MAATNYPDDGDLQTYLTEIGITATISADTKTNAIADAIYWAERFTGRTFTTSDSSETRKFDALQPQNQYTTVEVSDCHSVTSVIIGTGSALTNNEDYELLPHPRRTSDPIEAIMFLKARPSLPKEISVTAKYGWSAVPGSVKQAIIIYAAGTIVSGIDSGSGGATQRRKIGDREVQYAVSVVPTQFGVGNGAAMRQQAAGMLAPFVRVPYV
jgi:hypothetical protein